MKLGIATIGQSPRDDVVPDMFPQFPKNYILQTGALDGLSMVQIAKLAPGPGDHPLVTRLRSGDEVVISKEHVQPLMQDVVHQLERDGAGIVCVLCTGEFSVSTVHARLVFPDRLLAGIVNGLLQDGILGVVIPHEGQSAWMSKRWTTERRAVHTSVFSPYVDDRSAEDLADELSRAGTDMVVLDCMGYPLDLRGSLIRQLGIPVVHANSAVGAVVTSILGR
jgi:protein AroM